MKQPGDHDVRARLLEDLDSTFVVEAAAGTGKTTVLVDRIVNLVRAGRARLEQIISVTFTERAAGEMKLRLRDRLEQARGAASGVEKERLTTALEELEVARINTIHGLCADLLREYPVEARIDPLFEVANEGDAEALAARAFHRTFQALLQQQPEGVRRALRRRSKGQDGTARRKLFAAAQRLIDHRDFAAPWRRAPFDREASLDTALTALREFTDFADDVTLKRDADSRHFDLLMRARRVVDDVDHREAVALRRDHDGLEAQLKELAARRFEWAKFQPYGMQLANGRTEAQLKAAHGSAFAALQDVVDRCDADLAALLHDELWPVVDAYTTEKDRAGVLDFVDLLLLVRDLLVRDEAVRASLQQRFTHLFIDEFQDTDPLQSEIALLLASSDATVSAPFETTPVPGKLFVVGDPKQSIYRFRRADIGLYHRVRRHLEANGARVEFLSTSFRSTPGIQAAVNGAFELAMQGDHQAQYVPLNEWRAPSKDQPSLIALPAPDPFTRGKRPFVSKGAVEKSVPDVVGGFIDWLVTKSGWLVDEAGGKVPVQPRHVCILFKRMTGFGEADLPRPYAQALEARKVPHVLIGGRSFHHREEVMALRTALFAVDRPEDELSVYATLRGPFFALTDEVLFAFKQTVGKLHPLRRFDEEREALGEPMRDVIDALGVLRALHFERNTRPVAATVHTLLEVTRAHAGVAFWKAGAQALANVLQLAEVSRRHERRATSFREVVESLEDEAEANESPEAPIVEQGIDGVRMMTVHQAKGLEFPVVVLAEPTANAARTEPSHWVDPERQLWVHSLFDCVPAELQEHEHEAIARDTEEALRLTYVAATRAKDLLVVPVCSEKVFASSWTEVLAPSLYPPAARAHDPKPAPGCPPFAGDVVIDREGNLPDDVPLPGLHLSQTGKNRVVWWDPKTLSLGVHDVSGLEADEALRDDGVESKASIEAYEAWKVANADAVALGATPLMKVVVARALPPVEGATVPIEKTDTPREGRPSGRRFGELVHACLAVVPLDADAPSVRATVEVMARSLKADDDEATAAVHAVVAALAHPRVMAARSARLVRREATIVDHLADGAVVEGVIDLAYELDDGWLVVEFKTDDAIERNLAMYETQTLAYVRAISAATGRPASGVILNV